ncbi:MAG: aminodeoxychorismate synthase component I [Hydrogenophilales bacterium]|nr:aminodeoxychorismate synthase component I [Hydrogenophilales bacterium]
MRQTPIPYQIDSAGLFEQIADAPWSMFFDSGRPGSASGRYDILTARPWATLVTRRGKTEIQRSGQPARHSDRDPFELIRELLGPVTDTAALPFSGGAMGYFAYDLAANRRPAVPGTRGPDMPDMAIGLYDWALVVDHERQTSHLVSATNAISDESWKNLAQCFSQPVRAKSRIPFRALTDVSYHFPLEQYRQAFARLQAYIRAGDCYQANLAQGFSARVAGDPWLAYQALRRISPTPHAAYLNLPFGQVLSASPERFLEVRAGRVTTQPIKGTRRRDTDPASDAALAKELAASEKDRAENLMIVDLLRNDLGKVCTPGSIKVPRLFEVESFSNVHHLVSTVTGELAHGEDALSTLRAAFPGGSITGAPKRRAMEIIAELEPEARGLYCGSIGYIGHDGAMDSNIAIRTLTWQDGIARFSAGGGIVADSDADAEYQECLDKASPIIELLNAHRQR